MLTVVHDAQEANDETAGHRLLLDEIVRDGARQMLAAALRAEAAAYVEQFADQLDENGHRLVVRNGHHQAREVLTAAGARGHDPVGARFLGRGDEARHRRRRHGDRRPRGQAIDGVKRMWRDP